MLLVELPVNRSRFSPRRACVLLVWVTGCMLINCGNVDRGSVHEDGWQHLFDDYVAWKKDSSVCICVLSWHIGRAFRSETAVSDLQVNGGAIECRGEWSGGSLGGIQYSVRSGWRGSRVFQGAGTMILYFTHDCIPMLDWNLDIYLFSSEDWRCLGIYLCQSVPFS